MTRFVLDASVAVAWCFEDERTSYTEALLDLLSDEGEALAPSIWPTEVANAFLVAERRGRIHLAQTTRLLERLNRLVVVLEPANLAGSLHGVLPIARQLRLAAFDAAYVELALRTGLPLATIDQRVNASCR